MLCEGKLYYNHGSMRWCVNGRELKQGDLVEVCCNDTWETVRIEYDSSEKKYYAVPYIAMKGNLKVRFKCC